MEILSRSNPRIQHLKRLHRGSVRRKSGQFLIEGSREVMRAAACGVAIEELFLCPALFKTDALNSTADLTAIKAPQITVAPAVFEAITFRQGPDGVMALARTPDRPLDKLSAAGCPLFILAEGIEKPGNIGALLRSADAAGVSGVIIADPVTDLTNPNVIRASQGTVFSLPIAIAAADEVIEWLRLHEIPVVALIPGATATIWQAPLDSPCCIAVGAEANGLSPQILAAATTIASLPMAGSADSLNVSTCAAIALFEAVRQRKFSIASEGQDQA